MKMTNRLISLLLCLVMISAIACLSVSAKTVYTVGDWVYEKINNDTEFEIDEYKGSDARVRTVQTHNKISITSVGEYAFLDNTTLTTMILSDPIHSIQSSAFFGATALSTVDIRGTVSYIGSSAFTNCASLKTINLESTTITSIEESVFFNCDSLEEVTLPDTVVEIKGTAFAHSENLAKVTIPASVTEISESAFTGCDNVVIYCYENSAAHVFAETNEIEYVLLDETPVETYILGDVDNDGKVTISDATDVQLLIAEIIEPYDENTVLRGDITKDEVLSIMDATYIQRYIAEFDDGLHIGETFEV
ncbi:MAG: leucine-rich repeat protein [Ruminococcus sp.]|nr:leucine-rich repeat protein [Ruminococcus sp.]